MSDYTMVTKAALLKALKASPDVTALISKAAIFPGTVPADAPWPRSRIASVITSPFVADGLRSTSMRIMVQGFSKDVMNAGTVTLPAEGNVDQIGSAFKKALDGAVLPLLGGGTVTFEWLRNIPLESPTETSVWYVSSTFDAEVTPP